MRPETQGLFGLRVCEPNLAESVLAERGRGKPRLARLVVGHCVSTKAAASRRTQNGLGWGNWWSDFRARCRCIFQVDILPEGATIRVT
jgi:hypothetical protein